MADLDPLGHKNEGPVQQACKDVQEPTPRSHPSGFILPAGLAGQYSRTVHSLTEPLPPWPNVGTALLGRSICVVPGTAQSLSPPEQSSQKVNVIFLILLQHKPRPALKSQSCCPHTPCSSPTPVAQQKTELTCPWASGMTSGGY